jgi:uncharacterized membrane protein YphA (DoxX/SURF4 family)
VTPYPPMSPARTMLLTAYRIGLGAVLAGYGAGSLLSAGGAWWLAGAELVAGALILFGLHARLAALGSAILIMVAGLAVPAALGAWPVRVGGAATAALSCALLLIAVYGSGRWTYAQLRYTAARSRELALLNGAPPDIEQIRT